MIESYPKGFAGFKRLTEELDKRPAIQDKPNAIDVHALKGDIVYQDVSFAYADATKVLNHIDLTIQSGETVALWDKAVLEKQRFAIYCRGFMK